MSSTSSAGHGQRSRKAVAPSPAAVPLVLIALVVSIASPQFPVASGSPDVSRPPMVSPVPGPVRVMTPFDLPEQRWRPGHRGVDLAATPLVEVRAPGDGTTVFAGVIAGRPVLSIDHGAGLRTTYEPVSAIVREGQTVRGGEVIGHLVAGHPGCPVEACLHWGARVDAGGPSGGDDDYVDPLSLLVDTELPITLKPTRPGDGQL